MGPTAECITGMGITGMRGILITTAWVTGRIIRFMDIKSQTGMVVLITPPAMDIITITFYMARLAVTMDIHMPASIQLILHIHIMETQLLTIITMHIQ
jgi:hypothetical protein